MKSVTIIFPHQLFESHNGLDAATELVLIEEWLFFKQYNFNKKKLVLHRASMKQYAEWAEMRNINVVYIDSHDLRSDVRQLIKWLALEDYTEIVYAEVSDDWLSKRINRAVKAAGLSQRILNSPAFLNTPAAFNNYFGTKHQYFQTAFYIDQRKQWGILVDAKDQPAGGQWSYDNENRQRFPKKTSPPGLTFPGQSKHVKEAITYVNANFPNNYGDTKHFIYPVSFADAKKWLQQFLEERFEHFGIYEDAIVSGEHYLHHSVLSPLLNSGLLVPQFVIDQALAFSVANKVALNSLEGFIRQIIGWREFVRIVYEREGAKQRTRNYWNFTRSIPPPFWKGTTGILPVDNVINKSLDTGYTHHIERLMVMGNFMLLCEFKPDDVYKWFMEVYIDAYDWVMVPNVYGMTQFADGGLMTTKPYISGSNYLIKMSDYPKGSWTEIWDALFWRFMHVHRDFFAKNYRLSMLLKTFDKMEATKRATLLDKAETYLQSLDNHSI